MSQVLIRNSLRLCVFAVNFPATLNISGTSSCKLVNLNPFVKLSALSVSVVKSNFGHLRSDRNKMHAS